MTLTASSVRAFHLGKGKVEGDELFEEFIDSDSLDSSDNGTSDRTNPDDWNFLFDFNSPYPSHHNPAPTNFAALSKCLPSPVISQTITIPCDADRVISLVELDSIKCPTHPHASAVLSRRKVGQVVPDNHFTAWSSRSPRLSENTSRSNSLSRMSHRSSRHSLSDAQDSRLDNNPSRTGASSRRSKHSGKAPASAPLPQSQWQVPLRHSSYQATSTSTPLASDISDFRRSSQPQDPLDPSQSSDTYLQALRTHSYNDAQQDRYTPYFQSSTNPYVGPNEGTYSHDFSGFANQPSETSMPYAAPQDPSDMQMSYARDQDYSDPQLHPWWIPTSGTESYPTTLPTTGYPRHEQVQSPFHDQSEFGMDARTVPVKRDAEISTPNFSNFGLEQPRPRQFSLEAPSTGILGTDESQIRRQFPIRSSPNLADIPPRKSASPSGRSQSIRKPSLGGGNTPSSSLSRTRKLSRTTSAGTPGREDRHSINFVNLTTDDGAKILTGVAPSGSSKTKARREKEAADRRRRLSRAAAKAVLDAGGDLETLVREGFVIDSDDEEESDERGDSSF